MYGEWGIQHYAINSMLYLRTIKGKYIEIYNEFISQLPHICQGSQNFDKRLSTNFVHHTIKIARNSKFGQRDMTKTNPDYDILIKRLHLYYNMKLVTFRIDSKRNLIIQFLIFVQPYRQPLILYQLEKLPVPIVDKYTKANSYTQLQIKKPCLALNMETYINVRQQS